MSNPVLTVRNLSVAFETAEGRAQAVDHLDFDLHAGEITGLVGESGCGKSVTALALLGLLDGARVHSSADSIRLAEQELTSLSARAMRRVRGGRIAMVFQEPGAALDPVFTIGTQLAAVVRRHCGVDSGTAKQLALAALERGGFADARQVSQAYPHQLSGGMQQLVMLAMATVTDPLVLIADEPTTALDVTTQSLVLERLRQLAVTAGTAILLVSHDLGVIAQCCREVMVMYCGRVVERGDYHTLYHAPRHPYTAGLLASVPRLGGGNSRDASAPLKPVPGQVPLLTRLPTGCHFAPRCKHADEYCRKVAPEPDNSDRSIVSCHHPLASAQAGDRPV